MALLSLPRTRISSRWRLVNFAVASLVALSACSGIYLGARAIGLFGDMQEAWHSYDRVSEQKITYLTQMHQYLGYSGLSQHLKDYLLHGDDGLLARLDIDLDQAKNAIDSYNLLDVSPPERAALKDLKALVQSARVMLAILPKLRKDGLTPAEIDTRINLNPTAAIAALDQLRWAWREQAEQTQTLINAKSQAGTELISLGWVFVPIMLAFGGVVFWLVRKLCHQIAAYENEKAALEKSERKFRDMAANVPGVIFQWYENRGGERGYLYVSPRCQELYGVSAEELQRNWQALSMHPDDKERYLQTVQDAFENRAEWSFEGRFLTPGGEEKWWRGISKPVPVNDEEIVFNGVIIDISLQKKMEEELRSLATTDGLTGANNHRHFVCTAAQEFKRAKRYNAPLSMMLFDLDFFKSINDTFGHAGGDAALRQFVETVRTSMRETDMIGRIGGEEFALMLPETNIQGAATLAERIRADVEEMKIRWDNRTIRLTVSIGIAMVEAKDQDIDTVLARADKALYTAKATGRNRVMIGGGAEVSPESPRELLGLTNTEPGPHGAN